MGNVIEARVKERKRRGKPRKGMLSDLKQAFSKKQDEKSDPKNSTREGEKRVMALWK